MFDTNASAAPGRGRKRLKAQVLLLCGLFCVAAPLPAQDPLPYLSTWSGLGMPSSPPAFPSMPSPYATPPTIPPGFTDPFSRSSDDIWSGRRAAPTDRYAYRAAPDRYQPDLTGSWRGSGGESVEIERNRARIWGGGGSHQSCSCVFFLVGKRLIAYSPDTDTVRKYWFKRLSGDRFALIDDSGNLMSFWRVR